MRRAWHALAAYLGLAIVATWPLARGLGRDVAWDLGDSVFVMWALAWDCDQLLAILRGDLSSLTTFFDANIFHPAALTLAYSEHFIAQAVQILPVWALTRQPDPLLQPAVPVDVRALGSRCVPLRPRAHW